MAGWKVLSMIGPIAMTSVFWRSNLNGYVGAVRVLTGRLRRSRRRLSEKPHVRKPVRSGRS